jgi:hypothetical protein
MNCEEQGRRIRGDAKRSVERELGEQDEVIKEKR